MQAHARTLTHTHTHSCQQMLLHLMFEEIRAFCRTTSVRMLMKMLTMQLKTQMMVQTRGQLAAASTRPLVAAAAPAPAALAAQAHNGKAWWTMTTMMLSRNRKVILGQALVLQAIHQKQLQARHKKVCSLLKQDCIADTSGQKLMQQALGNDMQVHVLPDVGIVGILHSCTLELSLLLLSRALLPGGCEWLQRGSTQEVERQPRRYPWLCWPDPQGICPGDMTHNPGI